MRLDFFQTEIEPHPDSVIEAVRQYGPDIHVPLSRAFDQSPFGVPDSSWGPALVKVLGNLKIDDEPAHRLAITFAAKFLAHSRSYIIGIAFVAYKGGRRLRHWGVEERLFTDLVSAEDPKSLHKPMQELMGKSVPQNESIPFAVPWLVISLSEANRPRLGPNTEIGEALRREIATGYSRRLLKSIWAE